MRRNDKQAVSAGASPRDGSGNHSFKARCGKTLRVGVTALGLGWAMGGTVGVGTIMFTLAVGPAAQLGMRLFGVLGPDARARMDGSEPVVVAG